jgi:diaminohydroxyphosphoribosylaminopyrimidine deaminase / 5-amino-6-(5-phosphoribosylamino)uracil reductase
VVVLARTPREANAAALRQAGVEVIVVEDTRAALRALGTLGVRSVLVEGGAGLAGALLREGLVDRLIIFQAPIVLGPGSLNAFAHAPEMSVTAAPRLRIIAHERLGEDLMTTYAFEAE